MEFHVDSSGFLSWDGCRVLCALGRGGIGVKGGEGDAITPIGRYPLRGTLFRADRMALPATRLAVSDIQQSDGWCDDPASPDYNTRVSLPHPASHEILWRDDALYDVVIEVGYNDDPVEPGKGSAIFVHIARPDYGPTEGCVSLKHQDMLDLLQACDGDDWLVIGP